MKQYKYLLFDADDTLFDFKQSEYNAFREICPLCGVDFSDELYREYSIINDALWKKLEKGETTIEKLKKERYRQLIEKCLTYIPSDEIDSMSEKMRDCYVEALSKQSIILGNALEVCRKLSENYTMYILTNGVSYIQRRRFSNSPLMKYFADLFISEEIGAAKPSKEYFDFVMNKAGITKDDCLLIGDSLTSDIKGAVTYGIDCVWLNRHGKSTDIAVNYEISSIDGLVGILCGGKNE